MMGDYNINTLLNSTRLSSEIHIFAESGYHNMIDKPTRIVDININNFSNQNQNARTKTIS